MTDTDFNGPLTFPGRTRAQASSDKKLMELVLEKAGKPERFEAENIVPYFWTAEISSDRVDSYFSTMDVSSLKNYARDASEGVAFMSGHDVRTLPLGQSLTGKFIKGRGEEPSIVEAEFYTVPGLTINNGLNTDQFMTAIDTGIVRDVSIGFSGGEWLCNICNRNMADWSDYDNICWHMPGATYPVYDKAGEETDERILCIANITNAGLNEVSAVYDGATPGASIRQAVRLAEAGRMPAAIARRIEAVYHNRFKIPGAQERNWKLGEMPKGEELVSMTARKIEPIAQMEVPAVEVETVVAEPVAEVRADDAAVETTEVVAENVEVQAETPAETRAEDAPVAEPVVAEPVETEVRADAAETVEDAPVEVTGDDAVEPQEDADAMLLDDIRSIVAEAAVGDFETDPVAGIRKMVAELNRMRPMADLGSQYRLDLIDDTINEGIAAFGNEFPAEQRRGTLNKLDIDEIKGFLNEYRGKANAALSGSAQTNAVDEDPATKPVEVKRTQGNPNVTTYSRDNVPNTAFGNA